MRLIDADELFFSMTDSIDQGIAEEARDEAPTIDAVPVRHGKWIYGNEFHWYTASCNMCGYQRRTDIKADRWNQWNYCPNCGAKMDEVEE